jgi:hypothetical protein
MGWAERTTSSLPRVRRSDDRVQKGDDLTNTDCHFNVAMRTSDSVCGRTAWVAPEKLGFSSFPSMTQEGKSSSCASSPSNPWAPTPWGISLSVALRQASRLVEDHNAICCRKAPPLNQPLRAQVSALAPRARLGAELPKRKILNRVRDAIG